MKIIDQAKKQKIKNQTAVDIIDPDEEGWVRIRFKDFDEIISWNDGMRVKFSWPRIITKKG